MFLLDHDDKLFRLPTAQFDRMRQDPTHHPLPRFAGRRVRMADIVVELADRQPRCVRWRTFAILTFDTAGCLNPGTFHRQQQAVAELALAPSFARPEGAAAVVDATLRFVAQGGRWVPSRILARHIDDAALDRVKCPRP